MGFIDNAQAAAVMQHQQQAHQSGMATVGLLTELLAEQRQTNRLLAALLAPEAVARLRAEDEAAQAAALEAQRTAPPEKKKRSWR